MKRVSESKRRSVPTLEGVGKQGEVMYTTLEAVRKDLYPDVVFPPFEEAEADEARRVGEKVGADSLLALESLSRSRPPRTTRNAGAPRSVRS